MEDFEVVISNDRKWKRIALLLKSHDIDKRIESVQRKNPVILSNSCYPVNYNTFTHHNIPILMNINGYDLEQGHISYCDSVTEESSTIEDDIEEIKKEIVWVKNQIKRCWDIFIYNL